MTDGPRLIDGRPCVTWQVWLPCDLLQVVHERARQEGISDSELTQRALQAYLELEQTK